MENGTGLLSEPISPLYRRYLLAALGSGAVESAYTLADAVVIGQVYGSAGEAALSVFMPVWNIVFGTGLMFGIGGSALYSISLGAGKTKRAREIFTLSTVLFSILSLAFWLFFLFFDKQLFAAFGGDEEIIALLREYCLPIKFVLPCYGISQMLGAFLRNDFDAKRAALAVMAGGIFNIIFDVVFVFGFSMGMFGAGLATALGALLSTVILLGHFRLPSNALRFARPRSRKRDVPGILGNGLPSFVMDMALGIIAVFFNRQIMALYNAEVLGIYGVICQVVCIIQSSAYAVGEAAQPLISANTGAGHRLRVRKTQLLASGTAAVFGLFWMGTALLFPEAYLYIFMKPNAFILEVGPAFLRIYGLSFLLLPFNIFATFYFQSVDRRKTAFVLTLGRGLILSGLLVFLLPRFFGRSAVWAVMPVTELLTAVCALWGMVAGRRRP